MLKVFDGDGFASRVSLCEITGNPLHRNELEITARFGFIDAPEIGQSGGEEARGFLESLIGGRTVELAILMKMDTGRSVDRFGRVVCVPYLAEQYPVAAFGASHDRLQGAATFGHAITVHRNIELEMVINGWAWVLSRYRPDQRYFDALADAQRCRRGIWAFDDNIPPWEFKRSGYVARRADNAPGKCPKDVKSRATTTP